MTKQTEALRMAIEAFEKVFSYDGSEGVFDAIQLFDARQDAYKAIQACKEALAQPSVAELNDEYLRDTHVEGLQSAQEPVAYRFKWDEHLQWHYSEYLSMRDYYDSEPLYTHPAPAWQGNKEFVGLSDDEKTDYIEAFYCSAKSMKDLVDTIEAKLKEKNT